MIAFQVGKIVEIRNCIYCWKEHFIFSNIDIPRTICRPKFRLRFIDEEDLEHGLKFIDEEDNWRSKYRK